MCGHLSLDVEVGAWSKNRMEITHLELKSSGADISIALPIWQQTECPNDFAIMQINLPVTVKPHFFVHSVSCLMSRLQTACAINNRPSQEIGI